MVFLLLMNFTELSLRIKASEFEHFGFARLTRPFSIEIYRQWLDDGLHAGMDYLKKHYPMKENPQALMAQARSAIVVAQPYFPNPSSAPLASLRTALYAQGEDYHRWFLAKLEKLKRDLLTIYPTEQFLCYADSKPVAERDLAARAGLGWIGKNGCLIDRSRGSLFFIGELYTTLDLPEASLIPDHCGTCDRCVTACPTQAIRANRTLDAGRCISYLNIEAKENPPEDLRAQMSDWFFGCDICQTVCPWNEKVFGKEVMRNLSQTVRSSPLEDDLRWCLRASNKDVEEALSDSPLSRARARGLKRNALVVIGNLKIRSLKNEVEEIRKNHSALRELADWTLAQLNSP